MLRSLIASIAVLPDFIRVAGHNGKALLPRRAKACGVWSGLAIGALALLWPSFLQPADPAAAAGTVPAFDHIFTIVMENHSTSSIIGNTQAPYINSLANEYGLATNYVAVTHPSLPNYLALIGGSTFGITSDCTTCFVNAPNFVADRVAPSGRTWKAYMESMPSACFVGDAYPYVQKHDPFIYFDDIRTVPAMCNKVVPYSTLAADLASTSTTPNYVWITPNMCNDTHDCSIGTGDSWLQHNVPSILNSPAFTSQNSVLFITYDEDDSSQMNHVATLVIAKSVPKGFRSGISYNHYSLLKTVEQSWGLASLTANDGNAAPMSDFFTASAASPTATPSQTPPSTATASLTATPVATATQTLLPTKTATTTPLPTSTTTGTPVSTPAATSTSVVSATRPGAPTNVTAIAGQRSATVNWLPPSTNSGCPMAGYTVKSSPDNRKAIVSGAETTATVAGLTPNKKYTFKVTAKNCAGTGPASAPSNVVIPTS